MSELIIPTRVQQKDFFAEFMRAKKEQAAAEREAGREETQSWGSEGQAGPPRSSIWGEPAAW